MLTIGELDRRIDIYDYDLTQNSYGEKTRIYQLQQTVWAKVFEKSGKQTEESEEMVNVSKVIFYIRDNAVSNLTDQFQISYKTNIYIIDVINEIDGRDRFLEIITTEKNNKTA
tara:strand:- start:2029 stop:2367 length:339 start_codon:yes stop_codon:yes gene_type:complete